MRKLVQVRRVLQHVAGTWAPVVFEESRAYGKPRFVIEMPADYYEKFGSPTEITVTVEPGQVV